MAMRFPQHDTPEDELRFLRGLLSVHRLAAALDVFLAQCSRLVHARAAFVRLCGSEGPVLTRVHGRLMVDVRPATVALGCTPLDGGALFVAPLTLGRVQLGALGFVVPGAFDHRQAEVVLALVGAVAEALDSAVLAFVALSDGRGVLHRLDELSAAHAFRPRARIAQYQLITSLGSGGMAQVMVARASGPGGVGRLVALKRILPYLIDDPAMVDQFLDEARIGMRLSHPNLVTFHDLGRTASGEPYIAMELVRGVDLDRIIYQAGVRLDPALVAGVVLQALEGLHAAHELAGEDGSPLNLVHRDLSPHNLMVGFDGRVKVLDFGVAKARNQRTVTLPGIVKGKPLYMSPEQAVGDRVDRRSDLFSVALIFVEALTRRRPFARESDTRTMEAIVHEPLTRPLEIDPVLWTCLSRALSKRPHERFRTALEMARALEEALTPVKPASLQMLSELVTHHFGERLDDYHRWERTPSEGAAP